MFESILKLEIKITFFCANFALTGVNFWGELNYIGLLG